MKKLGLIGGTGPESTIIYYKKLTTGVREKLNRDYFPNIKIESLSVFDVLDYCERQDYDGFVDYLLEGFRNLAAAGADCAALTGITPHIVFDRIIEKSPIPVISMIDTSVQFALKNQLKKIALFGTLPTMNGTFFKEPFIKKGIEVVTPNEKEKTYIGTKIATELEYGIINPETACKMKEIAMRVIDEEKVDAVVLGCTELPLIFADMELPVMKMDVMGIHIQALIDEIVNE